MEDNSPKKNIIRRTKKKKATVNETLKAKKYPFQQINHKRSNSISDNLYGANDFDQDLENNSFRFKTERTKKRVSFNQRIQIINIHNYKYENKILYYENQIPDDDKQDIPKPSKCLSCLVF